MKLSDVLKVQFHLVDFEELNEGDLEKIKLICRSCCSDFELIEIYKVISKLRNNYLQIEDVNQ